MESSSTLRLQMDRIINIVNTLKTEKKYDSFKIEMYLLENYSELYDKYPFICKYLAKSTNTNIIYTLLNKIEQIELGEKSFNETEAELGKELADKYIFNVIDKKHE